MKEKEGGLVGHQCSAPRYAFAEIEPSAVSENPTVYIAEQYFQMVLDK